jgi:hypothetical protein
MMMRDSLRHLRDAVEVPPIDPAREQALLDAFDHARRHEPRTARWAWAAAAALTLATSGLVWIAANAGTVAPPIAPPVLAELPPPASAAELAGFVPWPGAHALPPFESGEVRRIDLPVSELPALGLPQPQVPVTIVKADVVVGRDGFARAVRLVQ